MDGGLQFFVYVVAHFVAAGTKSFAVGCFHSGVKTTPKDYAHDKTADSEKAQAVIGAGAVDDLPVSENFFYHWDSP